MAQHDYNIANQSFPSFRTDLNNALSAIQTNNSGTSRPSGAVAGQIWLDTTNATSPTLKFYDGSDDISLATINYTANTVDWLDSSITITGLSTTATGTVLTLSDTATTSSVNLIIDNQKEVRFRETTANGTNYVAFKAPASLASDVTFTLPSADGTANQVLQTNGSGVLSFATVGGLAWQSVQTTGFTAVASRGYPCNTTSSAFTVTLPASATAGDTIVLVDYAGTFDTNALTINPNGLKIEGGTSNVQLTGDREGATLTYIDSTQGWIATSGIQEGTDSLSLPPYTVDFLVIAGGGGGGKNAGGSGFIGAGGGGAGGYRNSYSTESSGGGGSSETELTFNPGTVYTITVGAGGAGQTSSNATGSNGSNSSISGTGLTTITSTGGGGGGSIDDSRSQNGNSGGSGGGAGGNQNSTGGSGTANQGYAGGNQTGNAAGPGGGGASAVGTSISSGTNGGAGGAGLSSSITGSSVGRAGGGGGGPYTGTAGSASNGGGAGGATGGNAGTAGTANTGGGGGGGGGNGTPGNGASGGSGVIILRMLTSNYSGTTTGSPNVSISGSDTILTFNASGSYTG